MCSKYIYYFLLRKFSGNVLQFSKMQLEKKQNCLEIRIISHIFVAPIYFYVMKITKTIITILLVISLIMSKVNRSPELRGFLNKVLLNTVTITMLQVSLFQNYIAYTPEKINTSN